MINGDGVVRQKLGNPFFLQIDCLIRRISIDFRAKICTKANSRVSTSLR
jgi:hypothetical protein